MAAPPRLRAGLRALAVVPREPAPHLVVGDPAIALRVDLRELRLGQAAATPLDRAEHNTRPGAEEIKVLLRAAMG